MKGFVRKQPLLALCGLECGLCPMYVGKYCPGCGGGPGNQSCKIAKCSLEHGSMEFCFQCSDFPCQRYQEEDTVDFFLPGQKRNWMLEQVRQTGVDVYMKDLSQRMAILNRLLENYNDGRRKSLYTAAACLLPLSELQRILETLDNRKEEPLKDAAKAAAALLQEAADRLHLSLKLRKKSSKA